MYLLKHPSLLYRCVCVCVGGGGGGEGVLDQSDNNSPQVLVSQDRTIITVG